MNARNANMKPLLTAIRLLLTLALLVAVYFETGWATTLALSLIMLALEWQSW